MFVASVFALGLCVCSVEIPKYSIYILITITRSSNILTTNHHLSHFVSIKLKKEFDNKFSNEIAYIYILLSLERLSFREQIFSGVFVCENHGLSKARVKWWISERKQATKKSGSNNFGAAKYSQFIALNRFSLDFRQIFPPIWGLCVDFFFSYG